MSPRPGNAEYLRARRAAAKAAGMCGQCRKRRAVEGCSTCRECLDVHELKQRAIDLGPNAWCVECQRGDSRHRVGCRARRAA